MSSYARRHHPQVIARKLASGRPFLNDWTAEGWRERLIKEFGVAMPSRATKIELYRRWLELSEKRS